MVAFLCIYRNIFICIFMRLHGGGCIGHVHTLKHMQELHVCGRT